MNKNEILSSSPKNLNCLNTRVQENIDNIRFKNHTMQCMNNTNNNNNN